MTPTQARTAPAWASGVVPDLALLGRPDTWQAPAAGWLRRLPEPGSLICVSVLDLSARAREGHLTAADGFTGPVLDRVRALARDSYDEPCREVPRTDPGRAPWESETRMAGAWERDAHILDLPATYHRARAKPRASRGTHELVDVLWGTDAISVLCRDLSDRPLRISAESSSLGPAVLAERLSPPILTTTPPPPPHNAPPAVVVGRRPSLTA